MIVKICGITNADDAFIAAEAGADLLGFIFYPKSPRYIPPKTAASITGAVRGSLGIHRPQFVGVFVNEPVARVRRLLDSVGLDLAQLHGREPSAAIQELAPRAYKAIRPQTQSQAQAELDAYRDSMPDDPKLPQLLVDAYHPRQMGGTGQQANAELARRLSRRVRLLLAGGLTPDNVAAAIREIRPWGVDVSSGIERSPGVKDPARVRAFIQAVRAAGSVRSSEAAFRAQACSPNSRETTFRGPTA
jgi:phosphoribosylanthranilate isomerase